MSMKSANKNPIKHGHVEFFDEKSIHPVDIFEEKKPPFSRGNGEKVDSSRAHHSNIINRLPLLYSASKCMYES